MARLHLNLTRRWFDMIKSGDKKEEYRRITPYWIVRLLNFKNETWETDIIDLSTELNNPFKSHNGPKECLDYYGASFRDFDVVAMKNGFFRKGNPAPSFEIGFSGIRVDTGKPDWGAEPGKYYFAIGLGLIT